MVEVQEYNNQRELHVNMQCRRLNLKPRLRTLIPSMAKAQLSKALNWVGNTILISFEQSNNHKGSHDEKIYILLKKYGG